MMKKIDLAQLNAQQKAAVETVKGKVLILAGAGSGKTFVLTTRMAHLIKNLGVHPKSILGLTFTNKAAAEMRHRLAKFVDTDQAKLVTLSTFHSFCMQILRQHIHRLGYTSKFTLYDEHDIQRLINMIVRDILQSDGELPSLGSTMNAINRAKNKGLKPEDIANTGSEWHDEFTREVYKRLQASLRAYNAVDFDHLITLTVQLFEQFPDVLDQYQEQYLYIMIDEYQDTNPIQYKLASLLAAKYNNLCVVGDDDQSIYGWRGAEIKNILEFDAAKTIKLEQNYRSTTSILNAANAVIGFNKARHAKALWSDKGGGRLIEIFYAPTEIDEAQAVVKKLLKLKEEQGLNWGDIAILYRSNSISRQIEMELMKQTWKKGDGWVQGIPYEIVGGVEFYERREVKDICAYLRVIENPLDQEALLRIINQPRRGIGEDSLDSLTTYNRKKGVSLWNMLESVANEDSIITNLELSSRAQQGIKEFVRIIKEAKDKFNQNNLVETLKWLIDQINYRKAIAEEVKSQQMRDFKWENVQEFVSSLAHFEEQSEQNSKNGHPSLTSFLSNLTLDHSSFQQDHNGKKGQDRIQLMTFHSSKGLEFPACFLVGMEDHIMPHEKSLLETGIEEERRLMYVAITRAKQFLTISFAKQRKRMGKDSFSKPSRFLFEIPKEYVKMVDWRSTETGL